MWTASKLVTENMNTPRGRTTLATSVMGAVYVAINLIVQSSVEDHLKAFAREMIIYTMTNMGLTLGALIIFCNYAPDKMQRNNYFAYLALLLFVSSAWLAWGSKLSTHTGFENNEIERLKITEKAMLGAEIALGVAFLIVAVMQCVKRDFWESLTT